MRKLLATACCLVVAGCVATTPDVSQNGAGAGVSNANDFTTGTDKWSVGCQDDQRDPYGKPVEKAKCWTFVTYNGQSNDGISMIVATIFEVSAAEGPRLVTPPALDTHVCGGTPRRKAVDGRRIDLLPMKQQIDAVLKGSMYVRETDRPWPYCNVYNQVTSLTGAKRAYDRMISLWSDKSR
ncbi:MAG: hypothetical protein WD073_09995 [Xanthobacteraceae bacterium]